MVIVNTYVSVWEGRGGKERGREGERGGREGGREEREGEREGGREGERGGYVDVRCPSAASGTLSRMSLHASKTIIDSSN